MFVKKNLRSRSAELWGCQEKVAGLGGSLRTSQVVADAPLPLSGRITHWKPVSPFLRRLGAGIHKHEVFARLRIPIVGTCGFTRQTAQYASLASHLHLGGAETRSIHQRIDRPAPPGGLRPVSECAAASLLPGPGSCRARNPRPFFGPSAFLTLCRSAGPRRVESPADPPIHPIP